MSADKPGAGKGSVPQGIEQLLILSGLNSTWKAKVLAAPLAAAEEARIGLSASERAILKSLPRASLLRMAASFERRSERPLVARLAGAAAVAAAALLAGTRTYAADSVVSKGEQAQRPASDEAPPIVWIETLPEALAQAAKTGGVVMVVIDKAHRIFISAGLAQHLDDDSQKVCNSLRTSGALCAAAKVLSPLSVWLEEPLPMLPSDSAAGMKNQEERQAFNALLKKYAIEGKLPAVLFLAPDGALLAKVEQPKDEAQLIDAMKTVPPQLAKWAAAQHENAPPNPVMRGIRAQ